MAGNKKLPPRFSDKGPTCAEAGSLGGRIASAKLTPEQRKERARNAVNARWAKAKQRAEAAA